MTLIYGFCKSEIMNNVEYKIKIAIKVLKWEKRSENILEVYEYKSELLQYKLKNNKLQYS